MLWTLRSRDAHERAVRFPRGSRRRVGSGGPPRGLPRQVGKAGWRPPHCVLYMNADYLWPYDAISAQGDAIRIVDVHGRTHKETCDPGLYPSYLFDYSKEAARKAWLGVVARGLNASADGVYAGTNSPGSMYVAHQRRSALTVNRRLTLTWMCVLLLCVLPIQIATLTTGSSACRQTAPTV